MTVQLQVRVNPRSSRSRVCGRYAQGIKVSLCAPPVEGQANRELCGLVAKWLKVAKSSVMLTAGEKSRDKRLVVDGITADDLQEALSSLPDA